jgi:hypothetical protein
MDEKKSKVKVKKYEDYPLLQFSTDPGTKEKITSRIEKLREKFNKRRDPGSLAFSKSDIAIEALKRGLEFLEEDLKKK